MAEPRIVTPQLRLTRAISEPGGLNAAEAVRRASANLETIRPTCRAELVALLDQAEAAWAKAPDASGLQGVYALALRGLGGGDVAGAPGVDQVLKSLSDVIDAFRAGGTFGRAAVDVHLQSWRLLMTGEPDAAARDAILSGLRAVASRFA